MTDIVVFHSVFGLRPVELRAADRFRAAGHQVHTPDLYAGQVAATLEEGFAIKDRTGWNTIMRRAHEAVRDLPAHTVLVGVSMGAGVLHDLLPDRPDTAGVLLLHGLAEIPSTARAGVPVQLHVADPDPCAPPDDVIAWNAAATAQACAVRTYTYPGAGHFYTDSDSPDHDEHAAALTWQRAIAFMDALTR